MAGRKQKRALGNGLESLFGPEGSSGQDRTIPLASGGQGGIVAIILVAFVLGGVVEFLLSEIHARVEFGPPSAKADSFLAPSPALFGAVNSSGQPVPSSQKGSSVAPREVPPGSAAADFTPPPVPEDFHNSVVRQVIHNRFPLSPGDIGLLKGVLKRTQKAVHGPPPEGRAVSVSVSLDPGAQFPVIHLVPGIASTITVVDATGASWPIEDVIVGNAKSFPVRRMSATNGVVIEPQNNVGWTSLSLVLRGRGTPAVLKLVDSDTLSDTRVTARIEARGPNAVIPIFREPKPVVSSRVLAFLDGIPPSEARSIPVHGTGDMEAWRDGNRLFVRTHLDVLAPAWIETVSGPNGMKLYVFSPVSVITAAGEDGEMITIELGEGATDAGKG
ncbi:MAG: hypothetical protein M0041_04020 [Nitrospiraceae bacterium]|nr:hypothetical protein [Nitrospiraceae bacterium]